MVEQVYPSGRVVKNVLDGNGDLAMVQSARCGSTHGVSASCSNPHGYWNYAENFTYNAAGAVTSMQLGNGKWESTQFNSKKIGVRHAILRYSDRMLVIWLGNHGSRSRAVCIM
jgi:hypothetical protein